MLGVEGTRVVHVFNKMDLVTEPAVLRSIVAEQFERSAFVSGRDGRDRRSDRSSADDTGTDVSVKARS